MIRSARRLVLASLLLLAVSARADALPRAGEAAAAPTEAPRALTAGGWSEPVSVSTEISFNYLTHPGANSIAVGPDDDLHVVYTSRHTGRYLVYYRRHDSALGAWDPPVQVSPDAGFDICFNPCVSTDVHGNVDVVWALDQGGGLTTYHRRRNALTGGWSFPFVVDSFVGWPEGGEFPTLCTRGETIHIAWSRSFHSPDSSVVRYRKYENGWQPAETLAELGEQYAIPSLAASADGDVYVVWTNANAGESIGELQMRHYDPELGGWQPIEILGTVFARSPNLVLAEDGTLHLTWTDPRPPDPHIAYQSRDPDTNEWSAPFNLSALPSRPRALDGDVGGAKMTVDHNGHAHAFWYDQRFGANNIITRSQNGFGGWRDAEPVFAQPVAQTFPSPACDSQNTIHVVWENSREGSFFTDVYHSSKEDLVTGVPPHPAAGLDVRVWPNPFRTSTEIRVGESRARATAGIFDVQGRLVRRLTRSSPSGDDTLAWDGNDSLGKRLPAGVYFLRLRSGDRSATKKITRVR